MEEEVIQGAGFTVRRSKFDFFFGRVASNPDNKRRSSDNLRDLRRLGIDATVDGQSRLLQIFSAGLNAPEILDSRRVTQYGVNISRKVEIR